MSLKHATMSAIIVTSVYGLTFAPLFVGDIFFQDMITEVAPVRERSQVTFVSHHSDNKQGVEEKLAPVNTEEEQEVHVHSNRHLGRSSVCYRYCSGCCHQEVEEG